jgi:hypothetical protein
VLIKVVSQLAIETVFSCCAESAIGRALPTGIVLEVESIPADDADRELLLIGRLAGPAAQGWAGGTAAVDAVIAVLAP